MYIILKRQCPGDSYYTDNILASLSCRKTLQSIGSFSVWGLGLLWGGGGSGSGDWDCVFLCVSVQEMTLISMDFVTLLING